MQSIVTGLVLVLAGKVGLAQQPDKAKNDDRTRTFAAQKCRFTLPASGWKWIDRPLPNTLFAAESRSGLVLLASCAPAGSTPPIDQVITDKFDRALERAAGGELKKRGASRTTFRGVPCYQIAAGYADGRTTVSLCFFAHDLAYHIMLIGGTAPVEQHPEFEQIMDGFVFTEPPLVPADASPREPSGFSYLSFWILLIVGWFCFRSITGRKKKRVVLRRRYDDNFDDLEPPPSRAPLPTSAGSVGLRTAQYMDADRPIRRPSRRRSDAGMTEPLEVEPVDDRRGPAAGECRHCGYRPVAFGADECPRCGGSHPNPGVVSKFAGRGTWGGALLGALLGGGWGYVSVGNGSAGGAIAGVMIGTLVGLLLGLVAGLIAGCMARLAGWR